MRGRRRLLPVGLGAIVVASLFSATPASADDGDRVKARAAYDRGAAAHARGDDATAARELALADALVPSSVTLAAALEAATAADDAVLALTLCDRASRAPTDATLTPLVQRARAKLGRCVGHLQLTCSGECAATVDGARLEKDRPVVIAVGHHDVVIESEGRREERSVDVEPEVSVQIAPHPPVHEAPPPPPPPTRHVSPAWFITAASLTVVATGVAIGLGVDASNRYNAFAAAGCTTPKHGDCTGIVNGGEAAQLRTNILLLTSGVLAGATVLAGLITFRIPTRERASVATVAIGATGASGVGPGVALRVPLQ